MLKKTKLKIIAYLLRKNVEWHIYLYGKFIHVERNSVEMDIKVMINNIKNLYYQSAIVRDMRLWKTKKEAPGGDI